VTSRSPDIEHAEGAPRAPGQPARRARRRLSRLRALPPLARYITRTMPWVTLITSCLACLAIFAILVRLAHHDQATFWLDQGTIRLSLLPVAAALAFVPYVPFRPLTRATPVPAWVTPVGHLLLAAPFLAVTFWAQLRILAPAIPAHAPQDPHEPFYALIAQLIGWSAIVVAAAACTARSRFADLGGAIAAPVSFAVIAFAWYIPLSAKFLVRPPAMSHSVAIGWYAITAVALILTCAAMRDHWHRYTRGLHRPANLDSASPRLLRHLELGLVLGVGFDLSFGLGVKLNLGRYLGVVSEYQFKIALSGELLQAVTLDMVGIGEADRPESLPGQPLVDLGEMVADELLLGVCGLALVRFACVLQGRVVEAITGAAVGRRF
jgi:hypothetical protein